MNKRAKIEALGYSVYTSRVFAAPPGQEFCAQAHAATSFDDEVLVEVGYGETEELAISELYSKVK